MADNVPITAGLGTTVSTEEITTLNGGAVAAQHGQRIILAVRTADVTAVDIIGDTANGLDVDVTRLPALPAGTNNIGDVDVLTLPALPAGANVIGSLAANQSVNVAQINGIAPLMGNGATGTGSQRVTIASDNTAFSVNATPPTLTKATQGATGYSTQDLKDAGRVIVNAASAIAGVTAVTTEALLTLAVSRDGAATSNVTTIAVTSGKRYRVQAVTVGYISTGAAVLSGRFSLRMNPSGVAAATSPVMVTIPISQQAAALAQAGNEMTVPIAGGIEFSGTMQIGISQVCSAITGTVWASIIGYEY